MPPLVSVITPCYNGAPFIASCIESVLAQTCPDWEMLVIDDCSQDNSGEIIRSYAERDSRIRYFRTDRPSGSPAIPRNLGMEHARGRYLAFLDCDDLWITTKLEQQLSCFEQTHAPVVFSNYEKVGPDGCPTGRLIPAPPVVDIRRMYYGNPMGCLTVMVDTQATGPFRFPVRHHEDYIVWLELLERCGAARNTNTVTAYYRESPHSLTGNKLRILAWQWEIYRNVLHFNIWRSCYYYFHYAWRAYRKRKI